MSFRFVSLVFTVCILFASVHSMDKAAADKVINESYSKGEFSGVVVASKDGKVVYRRAVGLANRQFGIANTLDTKFRICSVTKQFTAVLIMQLVESGKVDLDKPITEYLPDFPMETGSKIKVRHLLLSASGLPTPPDEFYVSEDPKFADATFIISKFLQGDLTFQPGERFNYNNGDFLILGAIIAKVSGKPYNAVLKEKILEPLAMTNTGLLKNEDIVPGLASGYSYKNGHLNEGFVQIQNFGAAGAMYSNAPDMLRWNDSLLANKLLPKKATDEMFTASPKLGFVGLGSWTYNLKFGDGKTRKVVERQGYINGFCALNILIPEEKFSAVFLSNTETQTLFQTYAGKGLSFEVLNSLVGRKG